MSSYTDIAKLKSLMETFRDSASTEPSAELMKLVTKVTDANNSGNSNPVKADKYKLLGEIQELLEKKQALVNTRRSFNELSRSRGSSTASAGSIHLENLPPVPESSFPSSPPPPPRKLRRTRRKNRSRRRRS